MLQIIDKAEKENAQTKLAIQSHISAHYINENWGNKRGVNTKSRHLKPQFLVGGFYREYKLSPPRKN